LYNDSNLNSYLPFDIFKNVFLQLLDDYKLKVTLISEPMIFNKDDYILLHQTYIYNYLLNRYNKIDFILKNENVKKIIINSEPFVSKFKISHNYIIKNAFHVVEYNNNNLIKYINNNFNNISYIPISYSKSFETLITKKYINYSDKQYDVFFYGNLSCRRKDFITKMINNNIKVCHVTKVKNNQEVYNLANNSKLSIINHATKSINGFNWYRASFLISTRNLVLNETIDELDFKYLDKDMKNNLLFADENNFIDKVKKLITLSNIQYIRKEIKQYNYFKDKMNINTFFEKSELYKIFNQ